MHKQLRDLLNNKSVQVAFAPFMESMKANSQDLAEEEEQTPDSGSDSPVEPTREERLDAIRGFDRKPKEIRDYLDRFVIKQEQAKRVLSVAVCDHYNPSAVAWRMKAGPRPNTSNRAFFCSVRRVWGRLSSCETSPN